MLKDVIEKLNTEFEKEFYSLMEGLPVMTGSIRPKLKAYLKRRDEAIIAQARKEGIEDGLKWEPTLEDAED
jgi:hypothetical protein